MFLEPEREEAEGAIDTADLILNFVMQSLSYETKEPAIGLLNVCFEIGGGSLAKLI